MTEEEVIGDKWPMVEEEIRHRKDTVEKEDLRREEIDVNDQTERMGPPAAGTRTVVTRQGVARGRALPR